MLGVKDYGRAPMAWSIRPGFRGDLVLCDEEGNSLDKEAASRTSQVRTCKVVHRIVCYVQCSLP